MNGNQTDQELTEQLMECPHCNNKSNMEIMAFIHRHDDELLENEGMIEYWRKWYLLLCSNCLKPVLYQEEYNSEWDEYDEDERGMPILKPVVASELLYPHKIVFHHTPLKIQKLYLEADYLISINPRSSLVKIRQLLEALCTDTKAVGSNLAERINDLETRGVIPATLSEMAHKLRKMGNFGAHENSASKTNITREDAILTIKLCETILEYVYEAPEMLAALEKRLNELKL